MSSPAVLFFTVSSSSSWPPCSSGLVVTERHRVHRWQSYERANEVDRRYHADGDPSAVDDDQVVNTSVGEQPRAFLDARVAPHDAGRSRAARLAVLVHQITKGDDADRAVVIIEDGNSGDAELDDLAAREDEPVAVANVEQLRVHDVRDARHVSTESNAWTSEGERPDPFLGRALEPCRPP